MSSWWDWLQQDPRKGVKTVIHRNYEEITDEQRAHVDAMYKLMNEYAKANGIKLAYTDVAEVFVEAIATYLVDSTEYLKNKK